MPDTSAELLKTSFFGPMVPQQGEPQRVRHLYASIGHWFESAKFMPLRPDLRDAVLFCPSLKEARKFAKARQTEWRSDWSLIRRSVLVAGLGFLAIDRPTLGLKTMDRAQIADQLRPLRLPERLIEDCLDQFETWRKGPKVGSFGAGAAPEGVVGKKMSKVVQAKPSWTLVSLCNNKTAWHLHDWALVHFVPVHYVGKPDSRVTNRLIESFVDACDQVVIFEVRGGKANDRAIQITRMKKRICSLELFRPEEYSQGELA